MGKPLGRRKSPGYCDLVSLPEMAAIVSSNDQQTSANRESKERNKGVLEAHPATVHAANNFNDASHRLMGVYKLSEDLARVRPGYGVNLLPRLHSSADGRFQRANEPSAKQSRSNTLGCKLRTHVSPSCRFIHGAGVDSVGAREVTQALHDAPRVSSIRLPIGLTGRRSGDNL